MEKRKTLDLRRLPLQSCILITNIWVSVPFCCRYWSKVRRKLWRNGFMRNRWKLKRKWNLQPYESVCRLRTVPGLGEEVGALVELFPIFDIVYSLRWSRGVDLSWWFGLFSWRADSCSGGAAWLNPMPRGESLMSRRREGSGRLLET